MDIVLVNGLGPRIAGDGFSCDTVLEGCSICGGIGGFFAAFGLSDGAPSFVFLDLASNGQNASAAARVRIPLGGKD